MKNAPKKTHPKKHSRKNAPEKCFRKNTLEKTLPKIRPRKNALILNDDLYRLIGTGACFADGEVYLGEAVRQHVAQGFYDHVLGGEVPRVKGGDTV